MEVAEVRTVEIFHDLEAMEHEMEYMGRVNEVRSPEERQASRARDKEEWNRRQRPDKCCISLTSHHFQTFARPCMLLACETTSFLQS